MITMTSLVVSITVVVMSLAANQFGPRLIWSFIEDRRIQAVIGLFIATILYTLLVLRTVEDQLGPEAVPHVAITVASVLTVACLFALLFHVNLVARSIVSDTMPMRSTLRSASCPKPKLRVRFSRWAAE